MALLVNYHFAKYMSFRLLRFRYSTDLTSLSLRATEMKEVHSGNALNDHFVFFSF